MQFDTLLNKKHCNRIPGVLQLFFQEWALESVRIKKSIYWIIWNQSTPLRPFLGSFLFWVDFFYREPFYVGFCCWNLMIFCWNLIIFYWNLIIFSCISLLNKIIFLLESNNIQFDFIVR